MGCLNAAGLCEKACHGGWSPGCINLAALYESGAGVGKDLQKAKAYYSKGCELESADGCKAVKRLTAT
jgi:TPR repeat protein